MKTDGLVDVKELETIHRTNIMTAYSSGMSVIEITDALQANKVEFVYEILRSSRLIPLLDKRDNKSSRELDSRLQAALKKRSYSFNLWCLSWKLNPAETAEMLKRSPEKAVSSAHEAVRRDFPEVYCEMFGGTPSENSWREKKSLPRLSLNVVWDETRKGYIASVPEIPGVMAKGNKWMSALDNMLAVLRLQRYIGLLGNVLKMRGNLSLCP
jgi:hypothetical protein